MSFLGERNAIALGVSQHAVLGSGPLLTQLSPSLLLQFAGAQTLDPRITFTRSTTATYFNSAGVLSTAAINEPRFDYNPVTLAPLGLLIESSRTNLLLNSATLSTQNVTVTAVATTLSFYGTGTVTLSGTATGTLVGTGASPSRVSLTFTPTAGTLTLTVSGSVVNAQLEAGAFATSYIPTVASQVTRAADAASMTGTNFTSWYNATEGTLFSEASSYDVSSARVGFVINDGTTANRSLTGHGSAPRGFISVGGATQMTQALASATFSNNTASKVSLAYLLNNGNAAANGTLGTLDTAMTIPVVTQAQIGSQVLAAASTLNGHIRRIVYYPRRLTDAELQGITS